MFKKDFGRFTLSLIVATLGFPTAAFCERVQIFDVHKNLQMSAKDPVYRDYYISAGRDSGLKENMIVPVVRSTTIHDPVYNVARGDLTIKVGQLKIIEVGEKMSVGRQVGGSDPAVNPVLDFAGLMIGDTVSVADGYMEKGAKSAATDGEQKDGPGENVSALPPPPAPVPAHAERKVASPTPAKPRPITAKISPQSQPGQDKPVPILGEVPGLAPEQMVR